MPEGDTVWNTAQLLHRTLAGATIRHSDFRVPALATVDLSGWRVRESTCRGKHLLLRLVDPNGERAMTLHSHLRMDGSWRLYSAGEPWRGRPSHLIRVILRSAAGVAVGYHLHELALVPTAEEGRFVDHLGPDLLGPPDQPGGWNAAEAVRRLRADPDRPIGEALLDQRNLAGVGNVYKCEICFLRGLHPLTPVSKVDDLPAVVDLAHRLLMANRGRWNQVTTGSLRKGEEHYVYGRAKAPCRRCHTPIQRDEASRRDAVDPRATPDRGPLERRAPGAPKLPRDAVDERVTYWCPRCQPAP